ncbi:MAG: GTPase HflX [Bacteroidetes bacterium]|nr:GTPase HflX [Bacteroidota bacterium]MDA0943756.1 GTPase HflX [Bacteroidota bacterium]MDA1111437.1 GTPase HflX [Bacteroidota bacterium]
MRKKLHETAKAEESAILIAVETPFQELSSQEYLDELDQLVRTAGATPKKRFVQKLDHPNPKSYVGKGKLEEIQAYVAEHEIDIAVLDDELSPAQIRNLETDLKNVKVLTRTHLILDIFAKNAQTAQAKTQVELAQSIYLLPRLTGMWTHLSKQKGGIGMKGPGETEIETDRRALRNKISKLRERLEHIEKIGQTQRASRKGEHRVALVGYTNVGKSTIMNVLSKSDVLVENKLFATLDSTVRKVVLNDEREEFGKPVPVLLSDTVGFIRKLPTQLVESFKSTLAEALEADLLIHVVDISNPLYESQMLSVKETLHSIGASNKPELIVFNKMDAFHGKDDDFYVGQTDMNIAQFEDSWIAKENAPAVFISAAHKENVDTLRQRVVEMLNP